MLKRCSFVKTLQGKLSNIISVFILTKTLRFPITKISRKTFYVYYFYCEKVVTLEVKKLDQGKRADCASVIKGF